MKTMRAIAFIAASLLLITSWAGSTRASLIQDITFSGGGLSGSGQIVFAAASGSDVNLITSLSLSGTGPLGNFSFDQSMIDAAEWAINESDWALTLATLDLSQTSPIGSPATCLVLGTVGGSCTATSGIRVVEFEEIVIPAWAQVLDVEGGGGISVFVIDTVTTTAVHDVPEPTSLALFLLGLIGIGAVVRRRPWLWSLGVR